jgi:thiopeptide-type bacteriocin biosynthesis protein
MDRHWLHYALYPGDGELLDDLVRTAVAPAVARAAVHGPAERWFFLRYTDDLGPHVRLRFGGRSAAIDRIYREVDPLLRTALAELTASRARGTAEVGCHHGFYELELDKYGGPAGVAAAEVLFQASSEAAIGLLAAGDLAARRRATALVLMSVAAASALRPAGVPEFWQRYEWHWSGGDQPGAAARRARYRDLAGNRAATAAVQVAEVAHGPLIGRLLRGYQDALLTHRDALAASGGPIASADSAFHQVHLTNNRLGIPPAEEGYLARLLLHLAGDC